MAAGEKPAQPVGVPECVRQIFHGNILAVGFQQAGVQQRRDIGQLRAGGQRADILDRDQTGAGVLGMEGGIERDLQIAVPALAGIGAAGLAHGINEGMHHGVGGIVA